MSRAYLVLVHFTGSLLNICPAFPWFCVSLCIQSILCQSSLARGSDDFCMNYYLLLFGLNVASSCRIWWISLDTFEGTVNYSHPPSVTYFIDLQHLLPLFFFFFQTKRPSWLGCSFKYHSYSAVKIVSSSNISFIIEKGSQISKWFIRWGNGVLCSYPMICSVDHCWVLWYFHHCVGFLTLKLCYWEVMVSWGYCLFSWART